LSSSGKGDAMKRHGAVLVFKEGVDPHEATAALEKIKDLLELPEETVDYVPSGEPGCVKSRRRPFFMGSLIREFDEEFGTPVWYIP
jgi:hypothetical protein